MRRPREDLADPGSGGQNAQDSSHRLFGSPPPHAWNPCVGPMRENFPDPPLTINPSDLKNLEPRTRGPRSRTYRDFRYLGSRILARVP